MRRPDAPSPALLRAQREQKKHAWAESKAHELLMEIEPSRLGSWEQKFVANIRHRQGYHPSGPQYWKSLEIIAVKSGKFYPRDKEIVHKWLMRLAEAAIPLSDSDSK